MTPGAVRDLLDPGDPVQVDRYERDFYAAYAGLTDNRLVRRIWDFDDARQRVRARIPYRDQIVYRWRTQSTGEPDGYLAVNVNTGRAFQATPFGFAPEPADVTRCCEFLNLMTPTRTQQPAAVFGRLLRDFVAPDLIARGFTVAYATCTSRRLAPYLRLGTQHLGTTTLDGEDRHFLRLPLPGAKPPGQPSPRTASR